MKKELLITFGTLLLLLCLYSCKSGSSPDKEAIKVDSATLARGEIAFTQNCSSCHNFKRDGIGPQLAGITSEASQEWLRNFIKNPKQVIESGDERAQNLFKKYHVVMPSFSANADDEIQAIISFLSTHKAGGEKMEVPDPRALKNPIPDSIRFSGLVAGLKLVTQVPASSDSGKLPLTRITKLDFQPNNGGSFLLDLRGKLYKLLNNQPVIYMDISKLEPRFINVPGLATGFGSFAFHPDFIKNGLLYTTHTEPAHSGRDDFGFPDSIKSTLQWVLTEWKTDHPGAMPFEGKGRELLRVSMVSGIHGVQEITFNPLVKPGDKDYGLLYIGIGDGGAVEEGYPFLAHSKERIWGTVLRIDPAGNNSRNGRYGIPKDNPFMKMPGFAGFREIYAYGFRNPHRITWSHTGQMLVCNVGHGNIESINLIFPGHDYGWPIREGSFLLNPYGNLNNVYPLPADDSSFHITYPVAQYDHDEGKAITGGYEYQGHAIPQLKGKFLFGDIPTGRLFYIDMADIGKGKQATIKEWKVSIDGSIQTLKTICGTDRVDLHFGRDDKGELYIMTKPDGKLYKIVSTDLK